MTALDRLLDFAAGSRLPEGGFGHLGADGRVQADRPLQTWLVARMTHVFGLAHLLGRPGADDMVGHGVAALTDGPLRDREHGGWFPSTAEDAKTAYTHAFVLLAGATATTAGIDGGRALLDDAVAVWQSRFWDDGAGMAVEEWDRAWTRCDDYRGLPANMHGIEASLAAADALDAADIGADVAPPDPATAARLRAQALRSTERVVHGWARAARWRLGEHFTADWEPLPDYNGDRREDLGRPYGMTVGHLFEWSRLALHVRAAVPDPPAWLLEDATGLFGFAATAWGADGHEGLPYTLDWNDRPLVTVRASWVLCQAVAAATAFAEVTGDDSYRELAGRWRRYGEERFADPSTGNWRPQLTPAGEPLGDDAEGQPDAYHLGQMLLLEGRPVRGSVAAALR